MADLVAAFICPHAPPMFTNRDAMDGDAWKRTCAAYGAIKARLEQLEVDTLVIVSSDHYVVFTPACLPPALIAIGEVQGPVERLPGLESGQFATNPALATHILETTRDLGFDLAASKSLGVDHGVGIPARLCAPSADCRILPIYIASGVEPVIRKRRAFDLGVAVGNAVRSAPGNDRVAIIGSGGISHRVGMPGMGAVSPDFDTWVLERFVAGDAGALIAMRDAEIVARAGNGALEIRNFLVALGAIGKTRNARVIAYEPAPGWFTGLGFAEALVARA